MLGALVVVVFLGVVLAWCSVYPQRPSLWPYTNVLWEFRSLNPSWPFWVGGGSIIPEMDVKILYFLDYSVIERFWSFSSSSGLSRMNWRAVVYQEFFMWLAVANVVGGVLGFLVSWRVARRFRLKADEWNGLRFLPKT